MKKILNSVFIGCTALLVAFGVQSCKDDELGGKPYADGEAPLGIKFEYLNRKLDLVRPGEVFQVTIRGLKTQTGSIKAFINEEEAEVVSFTDSTLDVRVPQLVSSGGLKVTVGNQVFFGPRVPIEGRVKVDTDIQIAQGFNSTVSQIYPNGVNFWTLGYFTNFNDESNGKTIFRNNIHIINSLGKSVDGQFKKGALGGINHIAKLPDGKFIVSGSLYSYNDHSVNNITRILSSGALDTMVVDVINPDKDTKPLNSLDTVAAFNAQLVGGTVIGVYPTTDNKMIAIGNFTNHLRIDYEYSSRDQRSAFNTKVRNITRLKYDGGIDSSFMYNNTGANGTISGAVQLSNKKIIAIGSFTTFNNESANRIVVFNEDGTLDKSFAGSGANDMIFSITYNSVSKKIALAGRFTSFNGVATNGVVLLNEDGTIDSKFKLKDTDGRIPTYAYVMNNGKVLVTGGFIKYEGINRSNLLILESDGSAKQEYNNISGFIGSIRTIVETTSSEGYPALLIGGSIMAIDGVDVGSIFRLEIRN